MRVRERGATMLAIESSLQQGQRGLYPYWRHVSHVSTDYLDLALDRESSLALTGAGAGFL